MVDGDAEVGLIQVNSGKIFYSFRRAEVSDAPLMVVFNGQVPVSSVLLGGGAGPMTVVADGVALDEPIDNPASLTRFANVLFMDAPGSGYGFIQGEALSIEEEGPTDESFLWPIHDAAELSTALLRFLDCRAPRPDMPVVLVGESQGAIRVHFMLWLLHAQELSIDFGVRWTEAQHAEFAGERDAHFRRLLEAHAGEGDEALEPINEALIGRQFVALAMIQGGIPDVIPLLNAMNGEPRIVEEVSRRRSLASSSGYRPINIDEVATRTARAIIDPRESELLLGVDLRDFEALGPAAREGAYRVRRDTTVPFLVDAHGELEANDDYYSLTLLNRATNDSNEVFVDNLRRTPMLMTDALFDSRIVSIAAIAALKNEDLIESWAWDDERATIVLLDGQIVTIPMPTFRSEHVVSFEQPEALSAAFENWLEDIL